MTLNERVQLYTKLLAGLSKGVQLAAQLREQGAEGVEQVERKNNSLAKEIATLRQNISKQWKGQASDLLEQIGGLNGQLQSRIRDIKREAEIAERVATALGYLDDLIVVAGRLLA